MGSPQVYTLTNGNYVVVSLSGGSVTWANGATGITGVINASNSVMAYLPPAAFGGFLQDNVTRLANGNFVVRSESVGVIPGAFTWMRGDGPTTGTLSVTNSLVISETWGNTAIFPLKNGDYVVCDTYNLRSAAIWGSGTSGVTGTVSDRNALLGPSSVDGYSNICNDESWPGQFLSFDDGSYAMLGIVWVGGSDGRHERAMTVVQGSNHFTGVVTMTNSLLSDGAKFQRLIPLTGTAFLLHAVYPDGHPLAGRSVFARVDATAGLTGAFTTTGGLYLDSSGWPRVMPLDDGNFVIYDGGWNGGRGIVHWHDGSGPMVGEINASNSLVGECADQEVGDAITPLRNGRYVIGSPGWEPCGSAVTDIGAATWMESGPATGSVSVTNSIVGNSADDKVGYAYFDTDYWDDQFGVLHNSGDWSMPVAEWDRGADTDVGALMSLPGDRRVTGTVAGLSHLAIYGLAADSGGSSGTFNALAEDQGHTVVSWWGTDQRMYLSRALWPALVANTVGAGKITGGGLDCGVSCTVDIHYGTPTVLTATGIGANDFAGWSGACSGLQPCTLPMTMTTQVTATFVAGTASSDASLNSLTLSDGTLVPAFASATTNYTASVANAVSSVTVSPTPSDAGATYTVTSASGVCAADTCALSVGANTITVVVGATDGVTTRAYVLVITRADAPPAVPYVSPSYGPPTTSTVSIISPAGGLTGATDVFVKGIKMFHVVRRDTKIDFTMKKTVAVAGTTVDVVLVKADDTVMTFTQSFAFEEPTTVTGTTASGAVLTTTSGVTVTVPPQAALRPAAPQIAGTLVITYAQVDTPAEPPGDVPLSFFEVSMDVDGSLVPTLTHPAIFELPVDAAMVPPGQRPWLYEWVAVGGTWSLVANQTYDPATGLVTAPTNRLGIYVLVTAAMRWNYFPQVGNIYAPLDSMR